MQVVQPGAARVRGLLREADSTVVWTEVVHPGLTPARALSALGGVDRGFILESAAGDGDRWSFVAGAPSRVLDVAGEDPLVVLEREVTSRGLTVPDELHAPFVGGAVGFLAYEAARRHERLPAPRSDPLGIPEAWFGVHDSVVAFDHERGSVVLIAIVHRDDDIDAAYERATDRLQELAARLATVAGRDEAPPKAATAASESVSANISGEEFIEAVRRAQSHIAAGDIFQVQLSRRFAVPLCSPPLQLYRRLRSINPSPYMVYLGTPSATLVGSSPEMLVRVRGDHVEYHPIAGTRRRGRDAADEARMERELRASEKERAEHLMLVDLGRNDVGRVSAAGSVAVTELMAVEKYSHVMHLVSSIEGRLDSGRSSIDALRSCFPAGTVTGAPKIRAMEIIAELEPEARGAYAGAVGYVGYGGDLDTAIVLRTIVVQRRTAYVQAAAGVVADSSAEEELLEIDNKARAMLQAIAEANAA